MVKIAVEVATNTLLQEDWQTNAVSTYTARTAHTTMPVVVDNWKNAAVQTYVPNSSWLSSCNSSAFFAYKSAEAAGFPASVPPLCPSGKWATGTLSAYYASKGIESAKSAARAQLAAVTTSHAATGLGVSSTQPAATQPTGGQAAAGSSPTVSYITIESTLTTYYTSTITLTGGGAAGAVQPASESADPGLKTVTTIAGTINSAAAVYVGTSASGIAGEHLASHRAHARHFGV